MAQDLFKELEELLKTSKDGTLTVDFQKWVIVFTFNPTHEKPFHMVTRRKEDQRVFIEGGYKSLSEAYFAAVNTMVKEDYHENNKD